MFSLSTSFLAFPLNKINQIIKILNLYSSTCKLVDSDLYLIYCKKFSLVHSNFTLIFNPKNRVLLCCFNVNKNITVNISGEALIRSCSKDSDFADFGDKFGCILNIQLSHVN